MIIKENYIIEKSSFLVEIKSNNISLQELRFLCIYLSKINARDVSTRCVRFPLSDFQKIMNIGRMNMKHFKKAVNGLLGKVVHMPIDNGGLSSFQLFKKVTLFKDDSDNWYVEIDAHDDSLPLFFNLKGNYLKYELWNVLNLKSVNQLRMYELLKRYEKLGVYEIKMSDLREYFCLEPTQYTALKDFKNRILDSCQKSLFENTDICYTYEHGKTGRGGKWLTIIFHISKNDKPSAPLELRDFTDNQPCLNVSDELQEHEYSNNNISFLAEACGKEFTEAQMNEIFSIIVTMDSFIKYKYSDFCSAHGIDFARYHYLLEVFSKLDARSTVTDISNRYGYFKKIILNDRDEYNNSK